MKEKITRPPGVLVLAFLAIEAILYTIFVLSDIRLNLYPYAEYLKYASIIICACFEWLVFGVIKTKDSLIIAIALTFTVIADYFLLFPGNDVWIGLISFKMAHTMYLYVISEKNIKVTLVNFLIRLLVAVGLFFLMQGTEGYDSKTLYLLSLYAVSFAMNIVYAIFRVIKNRQMTCPISYAKLMAGLLLFAMCDISVLIHNTGGPVFATDLSRTIFWLSGVLMWVFYLPSQIIIAMSTFKLRYL
ncbi:MAG: hypothetical protein E7241_10825 [Lachnospiraceae bacterium]|nr:hypothetical protein [Lachnospiraceae bacterium]